MESHIDALIAELAARQHGVVSRSQLLAAGVPLHRIEYRVKSGRLVPLHRGVYRVGPLLLPQAREMAAVLACDTAKASHRSAAGLWQLLRRPADGIPVDVLVVGADRGRRPGIRVHRVPQLDPSEVTVLDNIPVTTPSRTLIDLAGSVSPRELEQALAQAERRGLIRRRELLSVVERHAKRRGIGLLRHLLDADRLVVTRSAAEERCLALCVRAQLPAPQVNIDVVGCEVDFLWRRERVIVEVDGYAYHSSRISFENDRRRDAELSAAGYHVLRITWRQIVDEPEATVVRIGQTLARSGAA